jgi:hypothetical protein
MRSPSRQRKEQVREDVEAMSDAMSVSYLAVGALLGEIRAGSYYEDYGFDTFKEFVETELGFSPQKGRRLINIYQTFVVDLEVDPEEIIDIGWSKVSAIEPVATEDNVRTLLTQARDNTLSTLRDNVNQLQAGNRAEDLDEEETPEDRDPEEVYHKRFTLYDEQEEVVEQALEVAEQEAESDSAGHLLTLICQDYLAGAGDLDEEKVAYYLRQLEDNFDLGIIALDEDNEEIKYGAETLNEAVS